MKYLKTFEDTLEDKAYGKKMDQQRDQVWVVPLKMPDFLLSLHKIGMNDKNIGHWMHLHKIGVFTDYNKFPDKKTITIQKHNEYKDSYTWYRYPSTESDEYKIFMGKLESTPKEIQDYYDDIELKKDVKKYNL